MSISTTHVFEGLEEEFMRLPLAEGAFDCVAAERMFSIMSVALIDILALQRDAINVKLVAPK